MFSISFMAITMIPPMKHFFPYRVLSTLHNKWKVIERSGQKTQLALNCNYECDARTRNQLRNPWQFLHSEHMGRQPVIPHTPFVTDASTSRLQHVWPYCPRAHNVGTLRNVLRLSKRDDGEASNKYQSSCPDCSPPIWVIKLWEGSVWVPRVLNMNCITLQAFTPDMLI